MLSVSYYSNKTLDNEIACLETAAHSSILAERIPGSEEPGGLLSIGLHRVGHGWSDLAAAAACEEMPL